MFRIEKKSINLNEIFTGEYEKGVVHVWGGYKGGHFLGKTYEVMNCGELPRNLSGYVNFEKGYFYEDENLIETYAYVIVVFERSR